MSSKCHRIVFACLWSLLLAIGLASCKPSIPSKYLQPDEMEDVLYDYHLAQSMANQEGDAAVRQSAYEKAVLNKYGITQQQFDSSLQYYIRHTEQLKTIYEDISKRYETEARLQGASESDLNQFGTIKSKGDTTDIWRGNHTLLLSPYALVNQHSFAQKADSSFHKGDRFVFSYDAQYIAQESMRDAMAVLSVTFSNDSIATQTQHIYSDGRQTLTLENSDTLGIKAVKGYFLMLRGQQPTTTFKLLILKNITLVRMHVHKNSSDAQRSDSLSRQEPIRTIGGAPVSSPDPVPEHRPIDKNGDQLQPLRSPQDVMRERGIPQTR